MDVNEFYEKIKLLNIDENIIVLDDSLRDGYCIRRNHFRWEFFLRERGKEYELIGFPSQSDAMDAMFEKLKKIYGLSNNI